MGNIAADNITGRTYYERGQPVVVLIRWRGKGPRNLIILRPDGAKVVRPSVAYAAMMAIMEAEKPDHTNTPNGRLWLGPRHKTCGSLLTMPQDGIFSAGRVTGFCGFGAMRYSGPADIYPHVRL